MKRSEAFTSLMEVRDDAIVVSVFSSASDWSSISDHPLDFYMVGAMGQASSIGLGFAIGMPNKKVIVLDGDGSLLMNLGSVVTMASVAPPNLIYFVCQNNDYECIGSYPIPGREQVDFASIARAAGFDKVYDITNIEDFKSNLPTIITETGPIFVVLHVEISGLRRGKDENLEEILSQYARRFINEMNRLTVGI
jgi:phosphonopyruvate decarboxylase